MKAATGSCSVKKVFWGVLLPKKSEVFWIVKSRSTLTKLGGVRSNHRRGSERKGGLKNFANFIGKHLGQSLFFNKIAGLRPMNTFFMERLWATVSMFFKNFSFCVGYWHALEYNLREQSQSTLAKWAAKLIVLVKIYTFSWDKTVCLWGICLLPEKMMLLFSILNKYLPIVARYLEVLCWIIEYPAKSSSSEFIYGTRTAEFLGEQIPSALISGQIIWEKSSLQWE